MARMREASERAAFKALRAEERRMAQKEKEAKGEWAYRNWGAIKSNILDSREAQREEYLRRAEARMLKKQENDARAARLAAMTPRPKAGPGSVSDGKASLVERRMASGLNPETGKPMPVTAGAPGVKVGRSGTDVNVKTGRATGSAEEGSDPGLAIVHGGPRSKVVGDIVEKQMRQSITTGGYNQAVQQPENNRLDKVEEGKEQWDKVLEELDNIPALKAAYKGGKARRRARLQVLSRR